MKRSLKRESGKSHPQSSQQRGDHQRLHESLPGDSDIAIQTRAVREELRLRQCEFADVVTALKQARESRGMSLQDLCDITGITRASLSLLENGHGNPTMTTLRRVADAIRVEILVTVQAASR